MAIVPRTKFPFARAWVTVLDSHGNLVGVIKSKQNQADGPTFAIKAKYLCKVLQAIPADSIHNAVNLAPKSSMYGLSRTQQLKKLQSYIFMVKVYNN